MQLQAAVSMFEGQGREGAVDWLLVVDMMGGTRSAQQCSNRWNKTLRPKRDGACTGAWTEEEVLHPIRLGFVMPYVGYSFNGGDGDV